jgi:hypothetical protein
MYSRNGTLSTPSSMAMATALKVIDGRLTERDSRESEAAEKENCIA